MGIRRILTLPLTITLPVPYVRLSTFVPMVKNLRTRATGYMHGGASAPEQRTSAHAHEPSSQTVNRCQQNQRRRLVSMRSMGGGVEAQSPPPPPPKRLRMRSTKSADTAVTKKETPVACGRVRIYTHLSKIHRRPRLRRQGAELAPHRWACARGLHFSQRGNLQRVRVAPVRRLDFATEGTNTNRCVFYRGAGGVER